MHQIPIHKIFFGGALIGCWAGFVFAIMVLDRFYKDVTQRAIDEIYKQYFKESE